MIYIDEYSSPPHNGIRVGHVMESENVIRISIEYAPQSFCASYSALDMFDVISDDPPEPGDPLYEELLECSSYRIGRKTLTDE